MDVVEANGDLYEGKFERVYSEITRLDQVMAQQEKSAERLDSERDRRLDQRMDAQETAVAAALAAAEKAVTAALVASEKAVDKAEVAQGKVNETQNEFRGALKDQAATLMPRAEAENIFRELRGLINVQSGEIQTLRSRVDVGPPSLSALQREADKGTGNKQGQLDQRQLIAWVIAAALGAWAIFQAVNG